MNKKDNFDVIVIGGGHAGTEACLASSRIGARTLLITQKLDTLGQLSCNPSIGGIGKGHLTKEIDALGGVMARAIDCAGIHFRTLNASKGPAVQATRAQADRGLYKKAIRGFLKAQSGLTIFEGTVEDLIIKNNNVESVLCVDGKYFVSKTIILTVGTFLGGKILIGSKSESAGRRGDPASNILADRLRELPFDVSRLKTGTPPRLAKDSLDYSVMTEQPGDYPSPVFSFIGERVEHPKQISCHITHTTSNTKNIIEKVMHKSAMYSGAIEGVGPRYCPSIEDKVERFSDRVSHQVFVEPEGLHSKEVYPNGISTSLPEESQKHFVRSIIGFEKAKITQYGYAIEYDYFDPRGLQPTLETKPITNLFFAGQINGTTGYEEAAAQGLLAGINAANKSLGLDSWFPKRDEAYIGVLVDDLITRGVSEPYRMFTSRAEYRLLLREDNADKRLTPIGRQLGLIDDKRWQTFNVKMEGIKNERKRLQSIHVKKEKLTNEDEKFFVDEYRRESSAFNLLQRPGFNYEKVESLSSVGSAKWPKTTSDELLEQIKLGIEVEALYAGYINRQTKEIEKQKKNEHLVLPKDIDYSSVTGLSNEAIDSLNKHKPFTLGQASRLEGITPSTLSILLVYIKKKYLKRAG